MASWTVEELKEQLAMEDPEKTVIVQHGSSNYVIESVDSDPDPDHVEDIVVINVRKVVLTHGCSTDDA